MNHRHTVASLILGTLVALPAFAQSQATEVGRDAKQQERIEQGLKSGQLTTKEAGKLEKDETKVEKLESRDAADGHLSKQEKERIDRAQDKVSHEISVDKHNGVTGNPQSVSAQRLEKDVQRNANEQKRIDQGIKSGELSTREAGSLEHGQAVDTRAEARAAADGHVHAGEQEKIAKDEARQSKRIHQKKTN